MTKLQALYIENGMSKEESQRLNLQIKIKRQVIEEFKNIRKSFIRVSLRYGSQHIQHLKKYYGKKFKSIKTHIICENGREHWSLFGHKYWWNLMYDNMIHEEVTKRVEAKLSANKNSTVASDPNYMTFCERERK